MHLHIYQMLDLTAMIRSTLFQKMVLFLYGEQRRMKMGSWSTNTLLMQIRRIDWDTQDGRSFNATTLINQTQRYKGTSKPNRF